MEQLSEQLQENIEELRGRLRGTSDFVVREMQVGTVKLAVLLCEGQFDLKAVGDILIGPLSKLPSGTDVQRWLRERSPLFNGYTETQDIDTLLLFLMSGFACVLMEGCGTCFIAGFTGFHFRSAGEPSSEMNERGSREGFVEPLRINLSMVRRRVKNEALTFEIINKGTKSHTDVALCYMKGTVSESILATVRQRLKGIDLEYILDSGFLEPFFEDKPTSLFSTVGTTERPDVLCGKLSEGRIGILVDGTPFALIVPHLFVEHFQTFDDYSHRPFFATFLRWLKYLSFFVCTLLPGLYVGVTVFHPELLPSDLLLNIIASEQNTPLPMVLEALIIHLFYELMREAGLRLPRPVGHAIGVVGALVIGDAAVNAGIIGSPMVMIVALTAISSFVIPSLYESTLLLRFAFILAGGLAGLYGISVLCGVVLVNLCSLKSLGVPFLSPITPLKTAGLGDTLFRRSWTNRRNRGVPVQDMTGVEHE